MKRSTSTRRLKQTTLDRMVNDDSPRRKKIRENHEREQRAGVITSMVLKNFMCHSLLEVKFTKNSSIVIGQNGSGKSALLTALVIGLGGKASLTNRGSSIKGFVKAGKPSATVEITLHNGGSMAYRPQIYGDTITVIRHFTATGSSSYKIKGYTGEIISTAAREIQNITRHLNIQVDNPICVLNQDTSRNFLCSNDPKHKFTLFMKATKLESLASEYGIVLSNLKDAERLIGEKSNDLAKLKEDLKKLESKIHQQRSVQTLKEEGLSLQNELLWSKVKDAEQDVKVKSRDVEESTKKCEDCTENTAKRAAKVEKLKESIRELKQRVAELQNDLKIQSKPYEETEKILSNLKNICDQKDREKRSIQNTIKSKKQDIHVLEQDIENANQNQHKVEEKKAERFRNISDVEQKIKANDDILQTARNEIFQLKSDIGRKEEDERNLKVEIREIEQQINQHQERLNYLKNEKGNTLLLYGQQMPRVKQLIQQYENKFQHVPRGPLGSYIKLKDKKWAIASEGYIGPSLLKSFVVDNKRDNELLLQIFRKAGLNHFPTVITSKFFNKVHDVSENLVRAPDSCVGLYEILEIEDPVVANCVIDQKSVEGILLIPSDDCAMKLLSNRVNVPFKCTQGVTPNGDRYFPDPNYKTYCSDYHQAQYLQVDTTEHLRYLEQQINNLKKQKEGIMNQYNQLRQEMKIQVGKQSEIETKIRNLLNSRTNLKRELDELRSTTEPEAANVEVLEEELVEVRNILSEKTAELERLDTELNKLRPQIEEGEARKKQMRKNIRNLEERLPCLEEEIRNKNLKIRELSTQDEFDDRKKATLETRLKEHRAVLVMKQTKLQDYLRQAQEIGARPGKIRAVPEIMEKINSIERTLRQIQTESENVGNVFEQFRERSDKYTQGSTILDTLTQDVNELKIAAKIRKKHYKVTEAYFISYIKHSFKKILEFRQFEGSINIDVEAKKLDLIVMPQQGTQGLTTTSNLSGGEKSFSTVAFLYSLWQCMEFPFYFLDEFDVYMDKLNRSKVFDILLHHASTKPLLQFVFLTPQDISFLDKRDVEILKLEDPQRLN